MQRLYSMFPIGLPGMGLVLLRLSLATALWPLPHGLLPWLDGDVLFACMALITAALLIGVLTPVVASLCLVTMILEMIAPDDLALSHLVPMALMSVAVLLLGPGAYSVDARLYGHRVLTLPPKK
jgi:hypothetical protein